MDKRNFFLVFFLLNFCGLAKSQQLYPIADTAFLHYLKDSIPGCVKNDSLIIDSAVAHPGNMIINYENAPYTYDIYDIDGLQYFKSVITIVITFTHLQHIPRIVSDSLWGMGFVNVMLQSLPPLDSLPNMHDFSFSNDTLLRTLPDLNSLKRLERLTIGLTTIDSVPSLDSLVDLKELILYGINVYSGTNGNLSHLPDLSNNKELTFLDLSYNQVDTLPSLDSCSMLQYLLVGHNRLKAIPDLTYNTMLKEIDCSYNMLSSLPDVSTLSGLYILLANKNQLDTLPDLSHNVVLYTLDVDSNQLPSIPPVGSLPLIALHASANHLTMLPDFNAGMVTNLDLSHNMLTVFPVPYFNAPYYWLLNDNLIRSLPDDISNDSFSTIDISMNKLDFGDAANMKNIDNRAALDINYSESEYDDVENYTSASGFVYSPQKPFGDSVSVSVYTYSDTALTIASQQYADSYQWYHGDTAIQGATDTILYIYCATQADAGAYTCHSIGQYFNTHDFKYNYDVTEFVSEPQTVIVNPTIINPDLAAIFPAVSAGNVTFRYSLPEAQSVRLSVYDMRGRLAYSYMTGAQPHSEYLEPLDLSGLAAGTYVARVVYGLGYNRAIRLTILH